MDKGRNEIQSHKNKTVKQVLTKKSLYNDFGCINANQMFQLFGPTASKGSSFVFGSSEWLNKSIIEITVQIFWEKDIPLDFASYYFAYPQNFSNTSFKVDFSILKDGAWIFLNEESFMLFEENKVTTVAHSSTFILNLENNLIFTASIENSDTLEYNEKTTNGFIKMQLVEPTYGFGSSVYPQVVIEQIKLKMQDSYWERIKFWKKREIPPITPSLPYVPLVDKIEISITYLNPLENEN